MEESWFLPERVMVWMKVKVLKRGPVHGKRSGVRWCLEEDGLTWKKREGGGATYQKYVASRREEGGVVRSRMTYKWRSNSRSGVQQPKSDGYMIYNMCLANVNHGWLGNYSAFGTRAADSCPATMADRFEI